MKKVRRSQAAILVLNWERSRSHRIPKLCQVQSGNHLLCLHKQTIGNFIEQFNKNETKDIFNFRTTNSHSFLLSFLMSHKNEVLVIWLAVNNMKSQQKLLFFYYVKKILSYQKHKTPKTDDVLINQVLLFLEIRKDASFAEINIILTTFTKAQLLYCSLIVEICVRQR